MANLRIVYDNAISRCDTITASYQGSLAPSNLLVDSKTAVYRSTNLLPTIIATWPAGETISCIAIPFSNLSATAGMRIRMYDAETDGTLLYDTNAYSVAAPGSQNGDALWTNVPSGVNSFAYGGGAYGIQWVTRTSGVRRLQIDIIDNSNPAGYVEFAYLVVGDYWEPDNNPEWNAVSVANNETSKQERSAAGDLRVDRGVMYKSLSLKLDWLTTADKTKLWRICRGNGMSQNVFVSVIPTSTDDNEVQLHMIYGKLSKQSALAYQWFNQYTSTLDIQEN